MSRYEIEVKIEAQNRASREFKELERDISRVKNESQGAAQQTGVMGRALGALQTAAMGAGTAMAAMEIARIGLEMAQAGEQVVNTANRFRDLTGGTTQAAAALEQLRQVSRGMVTDTELMAGASRLLQMGIAGSVDEAAQLVEIAIALKQPTDSAGDAISNLALMIANLSYERLDALGLSAGYVRQRVNELKDAGMDMQEAFATAVIEQAADSMDRLAESTAQATTNLSQAATEFNNIRDTVNELAFLAAENLFGAPLPQRAMEGFDASALNQEARQAEQQIDELARQRQQMLAQRNIQEANAAAEREQLAIDERNNARAIGERMLQDELRIIDQIETAERARSRRYEDLATQRQQAVERETSAIMATLDMLDASFEQVYERGVIRGGFYDVGNMQALNNEAENYAQLVEYAADALSRGEITDQQYDSIRRAADEVQRMVDGAGRAAEALRTISLSELFGEQPGGPGMEIGRIVAQQLPENMRQPFLDAMGLATGERTALTQGFEQQFAPLIATITEQQGIEAGIAAAQRLTAGLLSGYEQGFDPATTFQLIASEIGYRLETGPAMQIDIPFNVGANWVEANLGMTMQELEASSATAVRNGVLQAGSHMIQQQRLVPTFGAQPFNQLGQYDPLSSISTGIAPTGPDQEPPIVMAANAIGQIQTDITTISATAAELDFSTMSMGLQSARDAAAEAHTNLQTLVDTDWVATVALDFVILDGTKWGQLPGFVNAVQSIMERSTRDNGGVPVGTNQVNGR